MSAQHTPGRIPVYNASIQVAYATRVSAVSMSGDLAVDVVGGSLSLYVRSEQDGRKATASIQIDPSHVDALIAELQRVRDAGFLRPRKWDRVAKATGA